jgi:hypothetical protein
VAPSEARQTGALSGRIGDPGCVLPATAPYEGANAVKPGSTEVRVELDLRREGVLRKPA